MVNFRFHLVSLTAVFFALALGIGLGATVVDQATVDALQNRLSGVEVRVRQTDGENDRLRAELGLWARFAQEAADEAVAGRLEGVPLLVVGVQGIDRAPVEALRQSLAAAGARLQGTVWFTSKAALAKTADTVAMADLLGLGARGPDVVRRALVAQVAAGMAAAEPGGVLAALRDAAFVEFEPPAGTPASLAGVPVPGTLFVVVSAGAAAVPNDQLAVPLAVALAKEAGARVLAVEPGRDAGPAGQRPERAVFVGPLRDDPEIAALVSTVDNLEDFRGRFAAVYALRDLSAGKVGHFGVGPRASRLVPETAR